jgi:hypothetical protein
MDLPNLFSISKQYTFPVLFSGKVLNSAEIRILICAVSILINDRYFKIRLQSSQQGASSYYHYSRWTIDILAEIFSTLTWSYILFPQVSSAVTTDEVTSGGTWRQTFHRFQLLDTLRPSDNTERKIWWVSVLLWLFFKLVYVAPCNRIACRASQKSFDLLWHQFGWVYLPKKMFTSDTNDFKWSLIFAVNLEYVFNSKRLGKQFL